MEGFILPEEVLIEVFDYLSPKMVKTASLVCKRWNSIISDSKQIMRKFRLNLEQSETMIKKAKQLTRKHQWIKAKGLNDISMDVISMHNLWKLQLSSTSIKHKKLAKMLANLPMLEVLDATEVDVDIEDKINENFEKVHINLKELNLDFCDLRILDVFNVNTLEVFKISTLEEECDTVMTMLDNQKSLKSLLLKGTICCYFFGSPQIFDFQFRLARLKIKMAFEHIEPETFSKYLMLHRNSLRSLSFISPMSAAFHECIFSNSTELEHLKISNLDKHLVEPIKSIESLCLTGKFNSEQSAQFRAFPNLKHLDLSKITIDNKLMKFLLELSKIVKNLQTLKIPNFFHNSDSNQAIKFPNLKEFSVNKIHDENIFNSFIRRHSDTLEKISILHTDEIFIKGLVVDEIMNCSNLKHVVIGSDSPLATRMFNKVSARKTRWTLESIIEDKTVRCKVPVIFRFPDDKAVWDDKCRIWCDGLIREFHTVDNYGLNAFVNKYK